MNHLKTVSAGGALLALVASLGAGCFAERWGEGAPRPPARAVASVEGGVNALDHNIRLKSSAMVSK